jgi:hypothetical protein
MKSLFWLFVVSTSTFANETVTTIEQINPDQAAGILQKALELALQVGGIPGAITAAIVMGCYAVIVLTKCFKTIADYFKAKKIREEEEYKNFQEEKIKQITLQNKREKDNYEASRMLLDQMKQAKLDKIISLINSSNEKDVLLMTQLNNRSAVSDILYKSNTSTEFKAIEIMKILN